MKLNHAFSKVSPGFTLLEVVVAMTIVGVGVVTLLELFSMGLRTGSRSVVASEAITYGRQAMDEILLRRKIEDGPQQGALNERVRWKVGIQPVKEPPDNVSLSSPWELQEITLNVYVTDAGRDRPVELHTYRLVRRKNP
jgi:prepilin-type N-terminal cleavage/methylation domain-containing protein